MAGEDSWHSLSQLLNSKPSNYSSCICSEFGKEAIFSSTQQIFTEHLLYASRGASYEDTVVSEAHRACPHGAHSLEEDRKWTSNESVMSIIKGKYIETHTRE